jgi:hypothetical protein
MADWKQITARIRRARTSKDPAGQLSALYEKTNDAMVAFELAKYFETSGQNSEAAKWYGLAAERFRRADWKVKAQEAAVRLGGDAGGDGTGVSRTLKAVEPFVPTAIPEPGLPFAQNAEAFEAITSLNSSEIAKGADSTSATSTGSSEIAASSTGLDSDGKPRRRRGRRGGRNRRKPDAAAAVTGPSRVPTPRRGGATPPADEPSELTEPGVSTRSRAMPVLPIEPLPDAGSPGPKGRYGDPGLSSRLSLLEMQFRRLLTCEAVKLEEANHAPVGPGVFVLTDSDLTSYYYVEACQTLRIAVANLLRGNSSRRGADSITKQLAEHLGIAEPRVPKYLAEHCVVRWLQLDDGASHFAHFVIAVLRPVLNE